MIKLFFIIVFITGSLYCQTYRDPDSKMSIGFNEAIDTVNLFKPEHYTIKDDSGKVIKIKGLGLTENTPIIEKNGKKGIKSVVIILEQLQWGRRYTITVTGVYDLAGNLIDSQHNEILWSFEDKTNRKINKTQVNSRLQSSKLTIINAISKDSSDKQNLPFNAFNGKRRGDPSSVIWTTRPIPEWIRFELDKISTIKELKLSFSYFENGRVYSFTVDYSTDGITWKTGLPLAYSIANSEWVSYNVNFIAKFIRINFITNSQSNYAGFWEVELYGNN